MIRAVFLAHSGFLVELPSATLLFDWWKGELPAIRPEVPLLVFASHHHPDHFNRKIFRLAEAGREIRYLLGKDIKPTARQKERWGLDEAAAARCVFLGGGQRLEAIPGVTVETLPSTDEGAAFLVSADGLAVFHAGGTRSPCGAGASTLPCCPWIPGWDRRASGAPKPFWNWQTSAAACPCTSGRTSASRIASWRNTLPLPDRCRK